MGYISTKTAVQLFPFLAFLLTLPYMILNYQYGSVNKLQCCFLFFYALLDDSLSLDLPLRIQVKRFILTTQKWSISILCFCDRFSREPL